ncbi:MAG: hypothetical protein ACR2OH_02510, partial [Microthrixaceae bacterium]
SNLAETVLHEEPAGESAGESAGERPAQSSPPRIEPGPEPEPIDLLGTAGAPTAQRVLPPLVAAVLAVLVIRWLLRRRRG